MNFLAHISLSGTDPKIKVGNFIGDFVKGKAALALFDPGIVAGIEMHRGIDQFTDSHPVVQISKNRLRPKYHHYSGVIVDMFYDHFLSANWKNYYPGELLDFARDAYSVLQQHDSLLPGPARQLLSYMAKGNWLVGYASIAGIHRALSGMAQRTTYNSRMNEAAEDLQASYQDYKNEFEIFFPDLQRWAKEWLENHNGG
jgi:acyl carrier protein phosphodiesterase